MFMFVVYLLFCCDCLSYSSNCSGKCITHFVVFYCCWLSIWSFITEMMAELENCEIYHRFLLTMKIQYMGGWIEECQIFCVSVLHES